MISASTFFPNNILLLYINLNICINIYYVGKIYTPVMPRRKAMTNLDSILKSRDIILLTKVHLVKAMVFPVVMYGFESWAIKKAEPQRIDAFEL